MRRRALVGLLTALAIASLLPPVPAFGRAQIDCAPSVGRGRFDPIVHHGHSMSMGHDHTFFGTDALFDLRNPNDADYEDIVGSETTCENPDDSALMWVPTLLFTATGQPVPIANMHVYYVSFDNEEVGTAEPLPNDLRMVAGNTATATTAPKTHGQVDMQWGCGNSTSRPGPYTDIRKANCSAASPQSRTRLQTVVRFPSCWDGQLNPKDVEGQTADYSINGGIIQRVTYHQAETCPTGYPHRLTKLRMVVIYDYHGNGTDIALSSDPPGSKTPGLTMHADFWNTWPKAALAETVDECVNTRPTEAELCGESAV